MNGKSEIYNYVSEINQKAYELLYKNNIPILVRFELLEADIPAELKEELNQIIGFSEIYFERHQSNLKNRLSISSLTNWFSNPDKNPSGA